MTSNQEQKPESMPEAETPRSQYAGDVLSLERCTKPCVWTIRMLTALIAGVKGGRWFRLFDKVFQERNLLAAFWQVSRNGGTAGGRPCDCKEL